MSQRLGNLLMTFDSLFNTELIFLTAEETKIALDHLQDNINGFWKNLARKGFVLQKKMEENSPNIYKDNIFTESQDKSEIEACESSCEESIEADEKTNLFVYLDENNVSMSSTNKNMMERTESDGRFFGVKEDEFLTLSNIDADDGDKNLQTIRRTEDAEFPYACVKCEKLYKSVNGVRHHFSVKHSSCEEIFFCEKKECSYSTTSRTRFRVHSHSHANNAPLTCPICSKEYLGGPKAMKEHMKIHAAKRDYKCNECEKTFISQSRLSYHIQNVHSEPSFHCDQCSKMFRSKVNFVRHMRIHTNEKPFQCPYCTFVSNHSTNLTAHVRSVHKQKNFTTGKEHKLRKKEILVNDIIENRTSNTILSLLGKQDGNHKSISQSLGQSLFQDLTERGQISDLVKDSSPQSDVQSGCQTLLKPSKPISFLKSAKCDKIITVRNSEGLLVKAVVKVKKGKKEGDQVLHVCVKD